MHSSSSPGIAGNNLYIVKRGGRSCPPASPAAPNNREGLKVEFRVLGPVELWAGGDQLKLPSTKLKQLLAALVCDAGQMVPTMTLVRRLWDEDSPPHELASLHSNVSRLRKCLTQCADPRIRLEYVPLGYRLLVPAESIDLVQFRGEVAAARGAVGRGRLEEAIRLLRAAEALVRGEPLAGLPGVWAREKRGELEELTRGGTLLRIELQLTARPQDARELLAELSGLAAEHEFDESVLELRMRALHLAGRTSEALHVYGDFRTRLREHSGLDPRASSQRLYVQLLNDDASPAPTRPAVRTAAAPAAAAPPAAAPRRPRPPDTLDRDPQGFVGRRADIEAITTEIERQLAAGLPAVCVIDGMPGIGKSTLAVFLAYRLRARCPDGAFQVNLRSHDERRRPTPPEAALDLLLGMLGAEPDEQHVAQEAALDYAIALWRRHTAGRRLLLVLDDVAEAEQILPLLPTGHGSIVLVTARTRLSGLPDVIRHSLPPLPDAEAAQLLLASARTGHSSDPALGDVVAACGGFPLALSIAGNTLRAHRAWSLGDLAEELADSRAAQHLDSVIAPALYRSFATSYRDLPELERRLLRRLSLNPGTRIHLSAATVLADASPHRTRTALYNLVEQNLLMEPAYRHYQLHDMMRLFAAHVCTTDEEPGELDHAADRLMRYTLGAADSAARLLHPHRHVRLAADSTPSAPPEPQHEQGFGNAGEAAAWLGAEQEWLRTVAEYWFTHGHAEQAAALTHLIARFMDRSSLWKESIALHEAALRAWQDTGNVLGQAHALTDIATAYWRLEALERSLDCARAALSLWSDLGDTAGEADALLQLGRVFHSQHRHHDAIAALQRCAVLRGQDNDVLAQAAVLHHLGVAEFEAGRYAQSIESVQRALALARDGGDLAIQRNCINSLGYFCSCLCDYEQARLHYEQALELAARVGDRRREAAFAFNLGECETFLHRPEVAGPLLERAYEISQEIEDVPGQVDVMIVQAHTELELGRPRSARALIDAAASVSETLGDPLRLSRVHMVYGHLYREEHNHRAAVQAYEQACACAQNADNTIMQGGAEHLIGDVYAGAHEPELARRHWRAALNLYGGDFPSPETATLRRKLAAGGPRRAAS
jgi:DNA-binding SARP family transcriptional activator/tetratricopeptide (TPR) repeat protein